MEAFLQRVGQVQAGMARRDPACQPARPGQQQPGTPLSDLDSTGDAASSLAEQPEPELQDRPEEAPTRESSALSVELQAAQVRLPAWLCLEVLGHAGCCVLRAVTG